MSLPCRQCAAMESAPIDYQFVACECVCWCGVSVIVVCACVMSLYESWVVSIPVDPTIPLACPVCRVSCQLWRVCFTGGVGVCAIVRARQGWLKWRCLIGGVNVVT